MNVITTELPGLVILEPRRFHDDPPARELWEVRDDAMCRTIYVDGSEGTVNCQNRR